MDMAQTYYHNYSLALHTISFIMIKLIPDGKNNHEPCCYFVFAHKKIMTFFGELLVRVSIKYVIGSKSNCLFSKFSNCV